MNQIKIAFLNDAQIEQHSIHFLNSHWDKKIPIKPEFLFKKAYNIRVIPVQLGKLISGGISGDFKSVYVDENEYVSESYRINFTIAHELGHKVLHETQIVAVTSQFVGTTSNWKQFVEPTKQIGFAETQAKKFAAYLLMPTNLVKNYCSNLSEPVEECIKEISDYFHVSERVVENRLRAMGLIK